ncbi:MAG: phenylacetate--CoA ligase family protein [Saprospiraceae bacterium]|nr:phenylacetate--CoA ligase family protein [Saprospiraceae bacterium]MBK7737537.1 phenylacetate--CoA ligase family protein [Saprospiraceae bacterium]MBK7913879.1 phenylacetate--CoA ligase family protein [Saprospiraceae bacterium]
MFDPANYTFGIEEIEKHIHRNLKVAETIKMQQRFERKWNSRKVNLELNTSKPRELIDEWQLERISLLIDYVYSNHPFYHQLYSSVGYERGDIVSWDDYNALPTISKQDIISNFPMFKEANIAPSIQACYSSRTSGSSGQVLNVYDDQTMTDQRMLNFFRFHDQILGRPRKSDEWLYDIYLASPAYSSIEGKFPIFTVSNECPIEPILKHIKLIKPTILNAFPSYLLRLGSIVTNPVDLGIKVITTNSESSTQAEREKISSQFEASVFDEYSSIELSLIAAQCRNKKYHIVEDNVRVDVLNPDEGGIGEIVATNLHNTFMPFIRYRQGDIIKISGDQEICPCGNKFRSLKSFMGRTDQVLYSKTIGEVAPDLVMSLYDKTLILVEANIEEFQIVQKKLNEVRIIIVPADKSQEVNQDLLSYFINGLKDIFNDNNLKIIIEKLDRMPPEKSHKRRLIKREFEP